MPSSEIWYFVIIISAVVVAQLFSLFLVKDFIADDWPNFIPIIPHGVIGALGVVAMLFTPPINSRSSPEYAALVFYTFFVAISTSALSSVALSFAFTSRCKKAKLVPREFLAPTSLMSGSRLRD